jgi:cytochrome c2
MRDDFEKELQDVLSGFNREPDAGAWQAIEKRIGGRAFSFLNPQVLMWGIVAILLGGGLWWQWRPSISEQHHEPSAQQRSRLIRIDTIYSSGSDGKEIMEVDTIFFDEVAFALYKKGRQLFSKNCGICHAADMIMNATGPALGGITKLRSREWLYAFTRNSQAMIAAGDPIAVEVWNRWKPAVMPSFLSLTDEELEAIYTCFETASRCFTAASKLPYARSRQFGNWR